jgi:hypothetical protein
MPDTLAQIAQLHKEGWCLDIFMPSGEPSRKNGVLVRYDQQGGETMRLEAPTLAQAIDLVWQAVHVEEAILHPTPAAVVAANEYCWRYEESGASWNWEYVVPASFLAGVAWANGDPAPAAPKA